MSDSPFADFANATLRFQVASGELVRNPKTGNVKPGRSIIEVTAMLDQARPPQDEPRPGVDSSAIYIEGFAVEPMAMPSNITPDSPCAAEWAGRKGQFFMEFKARSPFRYEEATGDEIRGYFQPGSFAVEEDAIDMPKPTKTSFGFGDATPKTIHTVKAGQTIFTVQIVIQVPFNGVGAALSLGDAEVSDRLVKTYQVDPTFVAEYETNPAYTYDAATPIILTIVPGEGCTQGSGYVLLEV